MIRLADIKSTPFSLRKAFKFVFDKVSDIEKRIEALEASSSSDNKKRKYTKKEDKEI